MVSNEDSGLVSAINHQRGGILYTLQVETVPIVLKTRVFSAPVVFTGNLSDFRIESTQSSLDAAREAAARNRRISGTANGRKERTPRVRSEICIVKSWLFPPFRQTHPGLSRF